FQLEVDAFHDLGAKLVGHEVVEGQAPAVMGSGLDPRVIDLDASDRAIILHADDQRAAVSIGKGGQRLDDLAFYGAPEFSEGPLVCWITIDRLAERRLELKPCRFTAGQKPLDVSASRADAPQQV